MQGTGPRSRARVHSTMEASIVYRHKGLAEAAFGQSCWPHSCCCSGQVQGWLCQQFAQAECGRASFVMYRKWGAGSACSLHRGWRCGRAVGLDFLRGKRRFCWRPSCREVTGERALYLDSAHGCICVPEMWHLGLRKCTSTLAVVDGLGFEEHGHLSSPAHNSTVRLQCMGCPLHCLHIACSVRATNWEGVCIWMLCALLRDARCVLRLFYGRLSLRSVLSTSCCRPA